MIYYSIKDNSEFLKINKNLIDSVLALNSRNYQYAIYASNLNSAVTNTEELDKTNPTRNFVILDFNSDLFEEVENTLKSLLGNPRHLIYRISVNKNDRAGKLRLLLELDHELNRKQYADFLKKLAIQMQIQITSTQKNIKHAYKFKPFKKDDLLVSEGKDPLETEMAGNVNDPDQIKPDQDKIYKAVCLYLKSDTGKNMLRDRSQAVKFFDSLAKAYLNKNLEKRLILNIINVISKQTQDVYTKDQWLNLLNERLEILNDDMSSASTIEPLSNYIQDYLTKRKIVTVGQLLLSTLPKNVMPSPDYDLDVAGNYIELSFPPYLLNQSGDDVDNLVIFNPLTGVWIHDEDLFYSLLTAIRPYSKSKDLETLMSTFAAKARNSNRFITPYHGSRYVLFKNCVVDVKEMKQIPLNSSIVHDLHFTERSRLKIDYQEDPKLPIKHEMSVRIKNGKNEDWNPRDFLMGYANNDPKIFNYLLFGLALGMFGGHNFGVHFDIKGGSRWGKTTLSKIYRGIYNNIATLNFVDLNTQFPFTSYKSDTSIIWIDETNDDVEPLNSTYGTTTYDNLADDTLRFQVKHKGDIVLSYPPQVYLTGTGLVKANEMYTGPAGRTLVFILPTMTTDIRMQSYATNIDECLADQHVLQWIVYNCLVAYQSVVPSGRIDDFKLILTNKTDLDLIPKKARDWRKELVIGGSSLDDWYYEAIDSCISTDPENPTYLHERIIYALYLQQYDLDNPNDAYGHYNVKTSKEVINRLKAIWESDEDNYVTDYEVGKKEKGRRFPRKQISNPNGMNFDWHKFDQYYERPDSLKSPYAGLNVFNKKVTGWIAVYKKTKKNTEK